MKRKQIIISIVVVIVLAALVYLQIREWRRFDWEKFAEGSEGILWYRVLFGVVLVYFADFLRAIRWKILLRPTRPEVAWKDLVAPTYVGFAGLAVLGRPGELIRPYLIGLKTKTSFSSQMAIWAIERIFDITAVVVMLVVVIFFVPSLRTIDHYEAFREFGYALIGIVVVLVGLAVMLRLIGPRFAAWACRMIAPFSPRLGGAFERKIRSFSEGLDTMRDALSIVEVTAISMIIWILVAFAYREVTHAYPVDTGIPALDLPQVVLLMGASVVGGVLQLPVVGGGAQLATIALLNNVFDTGPELAVSCGILFWLVTFMSITPVGLVLAHFEHLSLRKITRESESLEENGPSLPAYPPAER
ncbi:MAG TPA: lysylphosphatidylglycerol synthase transmembrane domain-containing protein [Terriglobales bacterium]|nr:lysylphosphatidylglycerol synthase transmembrane domain-containing protein [Terriglobales bacterium]